MTLSKSRPIRAVVVDDSPTARELIVSLLRGSDIEVVGSGESGEDAVRLAKRLKPDVMALDVRLKGMDGFTATRQIMRESPMPIILVTSSLMPNDTELTFQALNAGALTVVRKPGLADPETCAQLVKTVRVMAGVPVVHHWGRQDPRASANVARVNSARPVFSGQSKIDKSLVDQLKVVGVAASTGGPSALATVFRSLPTDFPWPILVVQHITNGFGLGLAQWMSTQTNLRVRMAEHGETPQVGTILFAPDDYHMQINMKGEIELVKDQPYKGLRPSANPLFQSLAAVYRSAALGIILTGMGSDGAEGMEALFQAGGFTIAQNEASCVIYGMPRAAVEKQAISQVLALEEIGPALCMYAAMRKSEA